LGTNRTPLDEKDVSKALILFTKGAKLAHPGALACIAYCYQNGIGVATDASKALKLAMLASKKGGDNYSEAQCVFGISSKLKPEKRSDQKYLT
jgi:TPR repeat protein